MYEVLVERAAERDLQSLPHAILKRILPRLKSLAENPRPAGCHKLTGSRNDWRIRIGDYRVVYEVDDARETRQNWTCIGKKSAFRFYVFHNRESRPAIAVCGARVLTQSPSRRLGALSRQVFFRLSRDAYFDVLRILKTWKFPQENIALGPHGDHEHGCSPCA